MIADESSNQSQADEFCLIVEQVTERLEQGVEVDCEDLIRACPHHAPRLKRILPTIRQMVELGSDHDKLLGTTPSVASRANELPGGRKLGDFQILEEIGRGGMGVVYKAEQLSMGRLVALKILPLAAMVDAKGLTRFKNEVRAAGTLEHPHIVQVYAVGEQRGVHYFAMQLIQGQSLARVIEQLRHARSESGSYSNSAAVQDSSEREVLSESVAEEQAAVLTLANRADETQPYQKTANLEFYRSVAELGAQAADALHHAHEHGIVHRDVKPSNLLVDGAGGLWLTDFGLARIEADAQLTVSRDWAGTLRYAAPEQALGHKSLVDHRVDIYSLGATLYEMLSLRPAREGDTQAQLLQACATSQPDSLCTVDSRIPPDLATIVAKSLESVPSDRYATAADMAEDLRHFLRHEPITATAPNILDRCDKWIRRNSLLAASLGGLLVIAVLCLGVSSLLVSGALNQSRSAQLQTTRERNTAQYHLYVSNMRLAKAEWENGNLDVVQQLLDAHLPADGKTDLRGWEWYYLQRLCHRDLATFHGHKSGVGTVAWSPDGRKLLSASVDCSLRIWDAANQQNSVALLGHTALISSAAWSPDGRSIASTSWDRTVRVWSVETGETRLEFTAGSDEMREITWSPDGSRLATCGDDGYVRVWDAQTGEQLLELSGHDDVVWSVDWSADGSRIASSGNFAKRDIRIWNASTGEKIAEIPAAHNQAVVCVRWSPDNKWLASVSLDQRLKVWDVASGNALWQSDAQCNVWSISWSSDGQELSTGGVDGAIRIWDVQNGDQVRTLRGHTAGVYSVDWNPDGKLLASGSGDHTVKVWDPHQEQTSTSIVGRGCNDWSPDGQYLVGGSRKDSEGDEHCIDVVDPATLSRVQRFKTGLPSDARLGPVRWSPDGSRIAYFALHGNDFAINVLGYPGMVHLMKLPVFEKSPQWGRAVAWSQDGHFFAAGVVPTGGKEPVVVVWNMVTGKEVARLGHDGPAVESVAWNRDGTLLATASWDQLVRIWDTTTWREVVQLDRAPTFKGIRHGGDHMIVWNHDGTSLVAGTVGGQVIVWDTSTWREFLSFIAHAGPVRAISLSPDDSRIATGGDDRSLKIWDAATGAQLLTLSSTEGFGDINWSPDGARLLTRDGGGIRVWDASPMEDTR